MTQDAQVIIGLEATKAYRWKKGAAPDGCMRLEQEIKSGKSLVILTGAGEIQRVVSVVALRVRRQDGNIFVQLAKWEQSSGVCPHVQLPGGKQERGEQPFDSVQRFLDTTLSPLADSEVEHMERDVTERLSKDYGVRTKYLRTVCLGKLDVNFCAPRCVSKHACSSTGRISRASGSSLSSFLMSGPVNELLLRMIELPVYFVRDKRSSAESVSGAFFAWLPVADFEELSSQRSEEIVSHWLADMEIDLTDYDASAEIGDVRAPPVMGHVRTGESVTSRSPLTISIAALARAEAENSAALDAIVQSRRVGTAEPTQEEEEEEEESAPSSARQSI